MAGRTFSARASGTLARTVSPLWSVLMTRTWSQRSLLEELEAVVWALPANGVKSRAAAAASEKAFRDFRVRSVIGKASMNMCPQSVEDRAVVEEYGRG